MNIESLTNTRCERIEKFKEVVSRCPDYDLALNLGSVIIYPPEQGDPTYNNNYRNYVAPPFNNKRKTYKIRWNSKIYILYRTDGRYHLMNSSNTIDEDSLYEFKCTNRFSFSFILMHEIVSRLACSYKVKVQDESFIPLFTEDRFNHSVPELIVNVTNFRTSKKDTVNILNISIF